MPFLVWLSVFLFGCLVGAAELTSRHSDHRLMAITTMPSFGYLFLNGILSLSALLVIDYVKPAWLGYKDGTAPDYIWVVLAAGFGAAAFFRSSIFKLKTPDGELSVGPALVIDIFLDVIDESVDRVIGRQRLREVA